MEVRWDPNILSNFHHFPSFFILHKALRYKKSSFRYYVSGSRKNDGNDGSSMGYLGLHKALRYKKVVSDVILVVLGKTAENDEKALSSFRYSFSSSRKNDRNDGSSTRY